MGNRLLAGIEFTNGALDDSHSICFALYGNWIATQAMRRTYSYTKFSTRSDSDRHSIPEGSRTSAHVITAVASL